MSKAPRVSVVMPAYNYARYVEQAVRSAWAQSYRPLELVCVDDGSTDGTFELLTSLSASAPFPMKVVRGEHKGVAAALNLGLKEAKGEYVCVLHADDYLHEDKVARQMAALEREPGAVLAHSEYVCVDEEGRLTGYDSSTDLPPATGESLRALLELKSDVRSMTLLFRKSALVGDAPLDERLPVEDWQSILRLATKGPFVHVPEPLVFRRVHGANISFSAHRKKKKFSFDEIARGVLEELAPADMPMDRLCARHSAVVIRGALALGAFEKALDGLRQCFREFPDQRAWLLRESLPGLRSYVWLRFVRDRLPRRALKVALGWKAARLRG